MKIYLARNNIQAGPYTLDELNAMLASGSVILDDLMWHSGMVNWQKIGEMTGGQPMYQPASQPSDKPEQGGLRGGFGDNVELKAADNGSQRVSVAELYGRKPSETNTPIPTSAQSTISTASDELVYASVGSRFLALAINMTLFIVAFLPFVSALMQLNPDQQKMTTGGFETRMRYAQTLAEQIPSQAATMTLMMVGGFFLIQLILIIMRGQSFGKLVTGIRAVDETTGKVPSVGRLLGVRTILLLVIYWVASAMPFNIAFLLVGVHYFMATTNPKKQGWHDRLAKTVVVKAQANQLKKDSSK